MPENLAPDPREPDPRAPAALDPTQPVELSALRIGPGVLTDLGEYVDNTMSQAMVIFAGSTASFAAAVAARLTAAGLQVVSHEVPDGEAAKTVPVLDQCWAELGRCAFTRTDLIVGVGGGAVTDLAGFVAATWLRGIRVIQVPTSINAMVDAAIGGKTGINTAAGKNLVGAFHLPVAVLADTEALATLPRRDLIAGMAEVIKCGFIADPVILELVLRPDALDNPAIVTELIRRAATVKQEVVAGDLRESHQREILNYGHTFGHAIELAEHFRWRHGEAVAVGMVFAAELARAAGLVPATLVARHRQTLSAVGLPIYYDGASLDELLPIMRRDKKTRKDTLRFVVLRDIAQVTRLASPPLAHLAAAFQSVRTPPAEAPRV